MKRLARLIAMSLLLAVSLPDPSLRGETRTVQAKTDERVRILEQKVEELRSELAALRRSVTAAPASAAPVPGAEASSSNEALLRRASEIERSVSTLAGEIRTLREDLAATQEELEAASAADSRRATIVVYGHVDGRAFEGKNSEFDAEAFELVLSGQPHERLGFFAEVEFEQAAAVGGERGGEVVLEQAYSNLNVAPWLNLRAGVLLVPFGNVNVDHYAPRRDVIAKPLVAYAVAPSDWTDNGFGFYGRLPIGAGTSLSYEVDLVAGLDSNITALGMRNARQGFGVDNNANKAIVGRMALRWSERVEFGASAYRGKYDDASRRSLDGWAVDGRLLFGPLMLTGEYDRFTAERLGSLDDGRLEGWYARATWQFGNSLLRATPIGKSFPDATLALVYQHDRVVLAGPEEGVWARNEEKRDTFGLNFRPSDHWVLKVNRESNRAKRHTIYRGNSRGWLASIGFVF